MAATINRIDPVSNNVSSYLASKNISIDREAQELIQKKNFKRIEEKFYLSSEIELHNGPEDCWLSWNGYVYNLTPLIMAHKDDPLTYPILKNAGKDISHWFDPFTGNLKTHINPYTECLAYYTPDGPFLHVPPPIPTSDWNPYQVETPWWLDKETYCIGKLSKKNRFIKIINTLTGQSHTVEVCGEEKLSAIQDRYLGYNAHAKGYMWKRLGRLLEMTATLEENGILDETEKLKNLGFNEDEWIPVIHLYFSDDLTVA